MKAYSENSVWSYASEVEVGSRKAVVVEETLTVEMEKCSDKGGGLVVYPKVTASMAYEAECGAYHRFPR